MNWCKQMRHVVTVNEAVAVGTGNSCKRLKRHWRPIKRSFCSVLMSSLPWLWRAFWRWLEATKEAALLFSSLSYRAALFVPLSVTFALLNNGPVFLRSFLFPNDHWIKTEEAQILTRKTRSTRTLKLVSTVEAWTSGYKLISDGNLLDVIVMLKW